MATTNAGGATTGPVPFKRSQVKVRYKNRSAFGAVVYPPARAFITADGVDAFDETCLALNIVTTTPPAVEAYVRAEENQIVLVPRNKQHEDWFDIHWAPGGGRARINLVELFQDLGVVVPEGSAMQVPITAENLPGFGPCVVLHMGKAETRALGQSESEAAPAEQL